MTKYRVSLEATASVVVDVEAENEDDAIDLAYENAPTPAWDWPDMGEWEFVPDRDAKADRSDYIWEANE